MKKRINIILIVISLILTLLVGCSSSSSSVSSDERFVVTYKQTTGDIFYIITDTETNVEYLYIRSGYSGSITKLEKGE
jgi:uncharacterized protein YcfL